MNRLETILKHISDGNIPHDIYKDGDKDIPEALLDRNGQVALAQCKVCGQAEGDLEEFCPPSLPVTKEITVEANTFARSTPFARCIEKGKITFIIEEDSKYISLHMVGPCGNISLFAESNTLSDNFEEALSIIEDIISVYGTVKDEHSE